MKRRAQVLYAKDKVIIAVPFNKAFVEELKQSVEKIHRIWQPLFKVWIVHPDEASKIEEMIRKYFEDVVEIFIESELGVIGFNENLEITRVSKQKWEIEIEEILKESEES